MFSNANIINALNSVDIATGTDENMKETVEKIIEIMGKPRNYGESV